MKTYSKHFARSVLFSSFVALSVGSLPAMASSVTYDVTKPAHTFQGFGSMIWNSSNQTSNPGGSQVQRLTDMHNNSPSLRIVRINHEARTYNTTLCGNGIPPNYTYAQYLTYWGNCGDAGLTGANSVEPTTGDLMYMIYGTVPASFKDSNNNFLTANLQAYADYLAALVQDFSGNNTTVTPVKPKYGKCPIYMDMSNEPDGSWTAYFKPADFNTLVSYFYTSLHANTNCGTYTQVIGPGVSHLNWTGGNGDPYTQALTNYANLGHWDVHGYVPNASENTSTGQTAILASSNWPTWAVGVKNKDPNKPINVGEYAAFATRFYYGSSSYFSSKNFPTPNVNTYNTAAYTTAFGVRVYSNAISLIGANVGPNAVAPYGASSIVYWQAADQSWQTGGGYTLIDANTNYGVTPQVVTPVYLSQSALYKLVPIGAQVIKAQQTQNQSSDVFSVVFYSSPTNTASPNCVTVAMANATYSNLSTSSSNARTTVIQGLAANSTVKSVTALRYRQGAGSNGCTPSSTCYPILEDISSSITYTHSNGKTTFTTPYNRNNPGLPMHSHLTTQFCYQ